MLRIVLSRGSPWLAALTMLLVIATGVWMYVALLESLGECGQTAFRIMVSEGGSPLPFLIGVAAAAGAMATVFAGLLWWHAAPIPVLRWGVPVVVPGVYLSAWSMPVLVVNEQTRNQGLAGCWPVISEAQAVLLAIGWCLVPMGLLLLVAAIATRIAKRTAGPDRARGAD